jgi:hypothetical protein
MPVLLLHCSARYIHRFLNRGNARGTAFHKADDYDAFVDPKAE